MFNQNFGRKIRMNLKDRISKMEEGIINMPTAIKNAYILYIYVYFFIT